MGVDLGGIAIYRKLIGEGRFPLRVYAAVDGEGETWNALREKGPIIDEGGERLTVRALKLYADGALGSRGAALLESYTDDPGNRGLTLLSEAHLRDVVRDAVARGFQVCTHAIGDRANHIVLNAYEQAMTGASGGNADLRLRIEHAQVLAPEDIPRFKASSILPMMQPTHCTSDMPWAAARLGEKRLTGAYAWRSLLATGTMVPAGSDFPVERPDPLLGFYAAVTRQDPAGNPPGGWMPGQVMTREEALKAFTLWGAYASFAESRKGSIVPGKLADFAVLTHDIMTCPAPEILQATVTMTVLGGDVVHDGDLLAGRPAKTDAGH
jgi:predicted amidohydrolase YtcJ